LRLHLCGQSKAVWFRAQDWNWGYADSGGFWSAISPSPPPKRAKYNILNEVIGLVIQQIGASQNAGFVLYLMMLKKCHIYYSFDVDATNKYFVSLH
jgi:hypothetical protein